MLGGDLDDRLEAQLIEIQRAGARAPVVGFVDRHNDRFARGSNGRGNFQIGGHEPFAAVDDKHEDIGGGQGAPSVLHDELLQRILALAKHPRGIG